jgi:hypothetical protein
MSIVTDNFQRPNQIPFVAPWTNSPGGYGIGLTLFNHGFAPPAASPGGTISLRLNDGIYQPDQSSQATIKSIAPFLATMRISAASLSGGNTTYTYANLAGTAIFNGMDIVISGMQNAGNNGDFFVASFTGGPTSGTFTVANASGVTESGSSGTGNASSDSLCGLAVRMTPDGKQGYYVLIGTNSGHVGGAEDSRVYTIELWSLSDGNNVDYGIVFPVPVTIPDSVGDIFKLTATGSTIQLLKNGVPVTFKWITGPQGGTSTTTLTDSVNQIGGYTGVAGQSLSSATPAVGNNGTVWTNWIGSDTIPTITSGWKPMAADWFSGAFLGNFSLQTQPWTSFASFPNLPTIVQGGGKVFGAVSGFASACYTGRTWANDQASSVTLSASCAGNVTGYVFARANVGSSTWTTYRADIVLTNGFASGGTLSLFGVNNGSGFSLSSYTVGSSTVSIPTYSAGDVIRIEAKGTTISVYQNGILIIRGIDSTLTSGVPGFMTQNTITDPDHLGFSFWSGDEFVGSFGISGNAGTAGATVSWTGTSSGSTTSDASGNFNTGSIGNGNYTLSVSKTGFTFSPAFSNQTINGANVTGVNFTVSGAYSVPDCRVAPAGPNSSRNVQGTLIYDVQTSSNPAVPGTDSRVSPNIPVDSRVSPNIPQNSRTPGTFGPGE